jgi:membrane associated rhomboid family serine protease
VTILIPLVILAGVALYLMTPDERRRLANGLLGLANSGIRSLAESSIRHDPFDDFLRSRTRWPVVTLLLLVLHVVTFAAMVMDPGAVGEPEVLIRWGANFAPRTTNGEWWRLFTSTFVHSGTLHLIATIAGLVPLGLVLERTVGHIAFAAIYFATAVVSSIVSLWTASPVAVSAGASGALFGMYGLAVATIIWAIVPRAAGPIPWTTVKRIGVAAAVFGLYNVLTSDLSTTTELSGLLTGIAAGVVVSRGIKRRKPAIYRAGFVVAATAVIVLLCALPLRGLTDIRPEIARVVAIEDRTARTYEAAVGEFKKGWISAEALATVIERKIIPEVQAAHRRILALRGVPKEHRPIVTAANSYLQLREEAWRRRMDGLVKSKMKILREADKSERAALEALQRMRAIAES